MNIDPLIWGYITIPETLYFNLMIVVESLSKYGGLASYEIPGLMWEFGKFLFIATVAGISGLFGWFLHERKKMR